MQSYNRGLLKQNAKIALKRNFWMVIAVVFVGMFLQAQWSGINTGVSNFALNISKLFTQIGLNSTASLFNEYDDYDGYNYYDEDDYQTLQEDVDEFKDEFKDEFHEVLAENNLTEEEFVGSILIIFGVVLLIYVILYGILLVISFLVGSFLGAPIKVGCDRFFMKNRNDASSFVDVFSAFKAKTYLPIVKTMFSTNLRIWAWSLVFYFPGLVKFYEYTFVSYIMAENPLISAERAREISKKMTNGYKWHIFVLGLSFVGWYILALLVVFILCIFSCGLLMYPGLLLFLPINAYYYATEAELYAERREYSIVTGIVSREELKGFLD